MPRNFRRGNDVGSAVRLGEGQIDGAELLWLVDLVAVGQVDTRRERLVGDDASKIRLGLIFRKHAFQLGMLVSEIVDKKRSAPRITKFNSRSDIDQVVPGQLSVRTGELVRVREENRIARAGV